MGEALLSINNLKTHFHINEGTVFQKLKSTTKAVDGISLELQKGEVLGLVGESGCGKSTLGRSIMQLEQTTSGAITFEGQAISDLPETGLKKIRSRFQMIFQDPFASLNPRMTVFDTLSEPLLFHKISKKKDLIEKVTDLMLEVGLDPTYLKKYPHEFSGGQRQRIAIARVLALQPDLIIADEPVSALDVSIQSQILNLLAGLIEKYNLTMIFISHDLSVIRHISSRTAVMYLGKIVEHGSTKDVFADPAHPYTRALFSAVLTPAPDKEKNRSTIPLKGDCLLSSTPPKGCRFNTRCPFSDDRCQKNEPQLQQISNPAGTGHQVACHQVFNHSS